MGPDREPVEIENKQQYLRIAEIIRKTGVLIYKRARIPIKSGLNLSAWEHHLKDYTNKYLLQYLKFGFPLSVRNAQKLNNTHVTNQFSAIAYPEQVDKYMEKENY